MISISLFLGGYTDNLPQRVKVSERQFRQMFTNAPRRPYNTPQAKLGCWSPALFERGTTRSNDAVQALSCVVYDFDVLPGDGWERITLACKTAGYAYALHTTWGHHPQSPRIRLLLPLENPIAAKSYIGLWEGARRKLGFEGHLSPDLQAKDLARMYVLPVKRGDSIEYRHEIDIVAKKLDPTTFAGKNSKLPDSLSPSLNIVMDDGDEATVEEIRRGGEGKIKITCPFQPDATPGSAFIRVTKNGRVFLQCTSGRHSHWKNDGIRQWWLRKEDEEGEKKKGKKSRGPSYRLRSPEERQILLAEVSQEVIYDITASIVYHGGQGVFYRWSESRGGWGIESPISKNRVTDSLVGKMQAPCDLRHAWALVDHMIEKQVYRMDHDSKASAIIEMADERVMNLYSQPEIEPVASSGHSTIKELIQLLSGNEANAERWLIHWSAALVQRPEKRGMTAVLSLSPQQGIGKSLYGRILARMIGEGNTSTVSNRSLRDNFNASYVTALLVLADEVAVMPGEGDVLSELKSCITDAKVPCIAPYAQRTEVTNRMSWWLTSNHTRPLMLEKDDRRVSVLEAAQVSSTWKTKISRAFNPATGELTAAFESEIADYFKYLVDLQVDWSLVGRPIYTSASDRLKEASRGSIDSFISDLRDHGLANALLRWPPETGLPPAQPPIVACETLYASDRVWCQRHGRRDTRQEVDLRLALTRVPGIKAKRISYRGTPCLAYTVSKK